MQHDTRLDFIKNKNIQKKYKHLIWDKRFYKAYRRCDLDVHVHKKSMTTKNIACCWRDPYIYLLPALSHKPQNIFSTKF